MPHTTPKKDINNTLTLASKQTPHWSISKSHREPVETEIIQFTSINNCWYRSIGISLVRCIQVASYSAECFKTDFELRRLNKLQKEENSQQFCGQSFGFLKHKIWSAEWVCLVEIRKSKTCDQKSVKKLKTPKILNRLIECISRY